MFGDLDAFPIALPWYTRGERFEKPHRPFASSQLESREASSDVSRWVMRECNSVRSFVAGQLGCHAQEGPERARLSSAPLWSLYVRTPRDGG